MRQKKRRIELKHENCMCGSKKKVTQIKELKNNLLKSLLSQLNRIATT